MRDLEDAGGRCEKAAGGIEKPRSVTPRVTTSSAAALMGWRLNDMLASRPARRVPTPYGDAERFYGGVGKRSRGGTLKTRWWCERRGAADAAADWVILGDEARGDKRGDRLRVRMRQLQGARSAT